MLTLRRPHELPCVQAVNSDVEIKNLVGEGPTLCGCLSQEGRQ
jgi:hypothetical protein